MSVKYLDVSSYDLIPGLMIKLSPEDASTFAVVKVYRDHKTEITSLILRHEKFPVRGVIARFHFAESVAVVGTVVHGSYGAASREFSSLTFQGTSSPLSEEPIIEGDGPR